MSFVFPAFSQGALDNCFGMGIPCGMLVVGGLALVLVIMAMKAFR